MALVFIHFCMRILKWTFFFIIFYLIQFNFISSIYLISKGQATKCSHRFYNCETCIRDSCTKCIDKYFLDAQLYNQCAPCWWRNSRLCDSDKIIACLEDFYLFDKNSDGLYDTCVFCSMNTGCENKSLIFSDFVTNGTGRFIIQFCFLISTNFFRSPI